MFETTKTCYNREHMDSYAEFAINNAKHLIYIKSNYKTLAFSKLEMNIMHFEFTMENNHPILVLNVNKVEHYLGKNNILWY